MLVVLLEMASQPERGAGGREEGATGGGRVIRIFVLPVLQSFNVLTCSKMKVWKFAAIASMLLSSMLSILVCRDMFNGSRKYSPLPSSPSSSRASSSSLPPAPRRSPRALQRHSSLLSQCKLLRLRPGGQHPSRARRIRPRNPSGALFRLDGKKPDAARRVYSPSAFPATLSRFCTSPLQVFKEELGAQRGGLGAASEGSCKNVAAGRQTLVQARREPECNQLILMRGSCIFSSKWLF